MCLSTQSTTVTWKTTTRVIPWCFIKRQQSFQNSKKWFNETRIIIFSRVLRDSTPRFVGPLVRRSVTLYFFFGFCGFWPYCSCPNDLVTSFMAPAHPHATGVAVYPALFLHSKTSRTEDVLLLFLLHLFHEGNSLFSCKFYHMTMFWVYEIARL